MKSDLIIVKAKVYLKSTADGGRKTPIASGYRPNHVFNKPDSTKSLQTFIGDVNFEDSEYMYPGETKMVVVRFLRNEIVEKLIVIGRKWFINESLFTIGEGEIFEIIGE